MASTATSRWRQPSATTASCWTARCGSTSTRPESCDPGSSWQRWNARSGDLAKTPRVLLVAALPTVPDQPKWALGAEYLVLAVVVTGLAVIAGLSVISQFVRPPAA